jgi:hypothetical protein
MKLVRKIGTPKTEDRAQIHTYTHTHTHTQIVTKKTKDEKGGRDNRTQRWKGGRRGEAERKRNSNES